MALPRRDLGILAILIALTTLAYANSLRNPFVIDDQHIIVRNFLLRQWTLRDIFSSHLFAPLGVETQYYRPLTLLTFALNYSASELNPFGYHIVNLGLHLLAVLLSYLLFVQFVSPSVAGLSAALFAVHPANVQAVSYISARSDPLYVALILLFLLCWTRGSGVQGARRVWLRSLSLALFLIGLFAKETAVVAPLLALAADSLWKRESTWRQKLKAERGWYLALGAVLALYLVVRLEIAGYALSMESSQEAWKTGRELRLWGRSLLALELLGVYMTLTLYPVNLAFFRSIQVPQTPFEFPVLLGAGTLIVLLTLVWVFALRRREITHGILWFLISLLPVLNLTSLNAPIMEHWLYLPLVGFSLAFVACVHALGQRVGEVRGVAFGLALLIMLLSAKTFSRNAEWREPTVLFQSDTRRYPNEEKNWFLLGYAYFERGMAAQAIQAYKTGLAVNPNNVYAWSGLGEALSMSGKDEEAEKSLSNAISIMPENPWLHYVLGVQRLKTGKANTAIEALKRAVSLTPSLPTAYHALGSAYLRQGKRNEAEEAFDKALSMLPRASEIHPAIHIELGKVYMEAGNRNAAQEEWQLALRFDPNSRQSIELLRREAKGSLQKRP